MPPGSGHLDPTRIGRLGNRPWALIKGLNDGLDFSPDESSGTADRRLVQTCP